MHLFGNLSGLLLRLVFEFSTSQAGREIFPSLVPSELERHPQPREQLDDGTVLCPCRGSEATVGGEP